MAAMPRSAWPSLPLEFGAVLAPSIACMSWEASSGTVADIKVVKGLLPACKDLVKFKTWWDTSPCVQHQHWLLLLRHRKWRGHGGGQQELSQSRVFEKMSSRGGVRSPCSAKFLASNHLPLLIYLLMLQHWRVANKHGGCGNAS